MIIMIVDMSYLCVCKRLHLLVYQSFRERDELLVALRAVRTSQQEAQQREWSAFLQVKQAVEMAEEANLYKARVRETYTPLFTQLKDSS